MSNNLNHLPSQEPKKSQERKADHIRFALEQQKQASYSPFEDLRFVHHSFSNLQFEEVDISTQWAGHIHAQPFYINGMTGGTEQAKEYNKRLAQVAHATGISMGVGSVSAAISDPSVSNTFTVIRQENPNGFILANLGAHHPLENAQKVVDLLDADAIQIHLNVPQEVVMPEGDRDFRSWSKNISNMVEKLSVPVVIKEVGFGMSRETIDYLIDLGVKTIDISGRGGTNFVSIENNRRDLDILDFSSLANWGQTTPEAMLESLGFHDRVEILASGGIRNYLDIVKALALGAKATGMAGRFLASVAEDGVEKTIELVHQWESALKHMMLLLGVKNIEELQQTDLVIQNQLLSWAQVRNLDYQTLANRSRNQKDS